MRSIIDVLVRQIKGEGLTAVGVDPNVQFTPGALCGSMFLKQPFTGAAQRRTGIPR